MSLPLPFCAAKTPSALLLMLSHGEHRAGAKPERYLWHHEHSHTRCPMQSDAASLSSIAVSWKDPKFHDRCVAKHFDVKYDVGCPPLCCCV
eukprot:3270759-Amphidinium_carterae.1